MILLPVPERDFRAAIWTTGLLVFNIVIFAITWPIERHRAGVVSRTVWRQSAAQLQAIVQPELATLPPDLQQALAESPETETYPSGALLQSFHQIQSNPQSLTAARRYEWEQRYPHFEAMTASMAASREGSSPFRTFGFQPQVSWFPGVLTHQFLHAGWWHLIGNMVFLWVVGYVLEFAIGGWIVLLYLTGGFAAAIAQTHYGVTDADIMVGASGAIAALMGFSLFAIPGAKIKLLYATFGRGGFFHSPLWFFLPFWLIDQILQSELAKATQTAKVGYGAHFGGFFFGAALAVLCRVVLRRSFQTPENPNSAW